MLEILKCALAAIAKRWKILAWTLAAILLTLTLAIVLRKFPAVRIPAAAVAVGIFLIPLLWLFPKWQVRSIVGLDSKDRFAHENEARQTLSQILGGLALLIGFYFTWQNLVLTREGQVDAEKAAQENLRIASEGQITDRFTKAIVQLGDSKLEIRLGGIYALERIAKDSPKDHWSIMEVLTAYVREHARRNRTAKPFVPPKLQSEWPKPAPDVQAILIVLGRRTLTYQHGEDQPLDLHETELPGADLREANLRGADLTDANLSGADLYHADLADARLSRAELHNVDLAKAKLTGAWLDRASLREASLGEVDLSGASLDGADLRGAFLNGAVLNDARLIYVNFRGVNLQGVLLRGAILHEAELSGSDLTEADLSSADLNGAIGLLPSQLESARGNADTKLPPDIPRPKSWQ